MKLSTIDYAVFFGLLIFSFGIGTFQGLFRSNKMTNDEFLIANGQMKILPTAMSLLASLMSATALLGIPLEIYTFGTIYLYWIFPYFIGTFLTVRIFIPLFRRLKSYSIYAYFERRFSLSVRVVITITFIVFHILYLGVVLYAPSLALSQVTGLNIWLGLLSSGVICTIYTSLGGMKAVIWTDVLQTIVMFSGVILSVVIGVHDAGGISSVMKTAIDGNRIQLTTVTLNPTIRYTIWSIILGGSCNAVSIYACLQTQAQRYLCVKSTSSAKKVAWLNFVLCSSMLFLSTIVGFLLYGKYRRCDPFRSKQIQKPDQLFPFFIVETFSRFPGFTGLFIAAIFSASLSTISSGVNSIVAVIFEDLFKSFRDRKSFNENQKTKISKIISFFIGILVISVAFAASKIGDNLIVLVFQITGSFGAPIFAVFLLGFFAPRVNGRNVLVALFICFSFQIWIFLGANLSAGNSSTNIGRLTTSISDCPISFNITERIPGPNTKSNPLVRLYSISFLWYSWNSVVIVVLISLLLTFIFGGNDPGKIDKSLLVDWKTIFVDKEEEEERIEQRPSVFGSSKNEEEMIELRTET